MTSALMTFLITLHGLSTLPGPTDRPAADSSQVHRSQDPGQTEEEAKQQQVIQQELELLDTHLRIDGKNDNAATHYRELFRELINRRYKYDKLVNAMYAREDEHLTDQVLYQTPEMAAYIDEVRRYRALIKKAVESERVDFGLQHEEGFNMLIPHLSHMRRLARQLKRTSRQLRLAGNMEESVEDLALILGMAKQVAPDRVLISSLVSAAIASVALNEIELALTDRQIDPSSAERLLIALQRLPAGDPFHYTEAIDGEYEMLERTFAEDGMSQEELEERLTNITDMMSPNEEDWDRAHSGIDRAWVKSQIKQSKPLFDRLADLMTLEDRLAARRENRAIMIAVEEGEYGTFNATIMPGIGRTINTKHFGEEMIEYLVVSLKAIRNGADPGRFGNAALVYDRVSEILPQRIRPRDQTALNMLQQLVSATGSCDQIDGEMLEEAKRILDRERDMLDMIRRASRVERCVWRQARMKALAEESIGEGRWIRPMRAMMRLMLAEAAVAFCNPDLEQGRSQVGSALGAALGLALQLGDGSHLFGQLASTAALEEFEGFLEQACWKGMVSRTAAESMRQRVQMAAVGNLDRWRLASDAMISEDLFNLIQKFGTAGRGDAMILGKRWSRDRLFMLPHYHTFRNHSDAEDGPLQARFNFVNELNSSMNRGELFAVEDVWTLTAEEREVLAQPASRLIDLLNRIDSIESPKIAEWQLRCSACFARLDTVLENCTPRQLETSP